MNNRKMSSCAFLAVLAACASPQGEDPDAAVSVSFIEPDAARERDVSVDQMGSTARVGEGQELASTGAAGAPHLVPLNSWMASYGDMWLYQQQTTSACPDPGWADHNMNCGPTCVAMGLNFLLDLHVDPACRAIPEADALGYHRTHAMSRWLYCDADGHGVAGGYPCDDHASPGATEDQMVAVFAAEGVTADYVRCAAWPAACPAIPDAYAAIVSNVNNGWLTIAHVNPCQYRSAACGSVESHWVVVYGYDSSGVYFQDPGWRGYPVAEPDHPGPWGMNRRMTRDQFVNAVNLVRKAKDNSVYFERVMLRVQSASNTIRRHPPGTLVKRAGEPEIYWIDESSRLRWLTTEDVLRSRRLYRDSGDPFGLVVTVSEEEFACYEHGSDIDWPVTMRVTSCSDGSYYLTLDDNGHRRKWWIPGDPGHPFFRTTIASWGFRPSEVVTDHPGCSFPTQESSLFIRDGTFMREMSATDFTYVMHNGLAYTMSSGLALDLTYDAADALVIPDGTVGVFTRGSDPTHPAITRADILACAPIPYTPPYIEGSYPYFGGGSDDVLCTPTVETCDNADNDCDGVVDNSFNLETDPANCGWCGRTCGLYQLCQSGECVVCGSADRLCCAGGVCRDGYACSAGMCVPAVTCTGTAELCNGFDDDCDGVVDNGFTLQDDMQNCGSCGNRCNPANDECHNGACRPRPQNEVASGCNNRDDDYDGVVDGYVLPCSGACGEGQQTCLTGELTACMPTAPPLEVCNNYDDDCDGNIDEGGVCPVVECDADHDGELNATCGGRDCDDNNASVSPRATERCNGQDDTCNGGVDEGFNFLNDPNHCGSCANTCAAGWVCLGGTCTEPCTPTGAETCNSRDDDCDGLVDEGGVCAPPPPACTHRIQMVWAASTRWSFGADVSGGGERFADLYWWPAQVGSYDMVYTGVCPGWVRANVAFPDSFPPWLVFRRPDGTVEVGPSLPRVTVDGAEVPLFPVVDTSIAGPEAAFRFCVGGACP